jgi:hypothetical protein
MKSTEDGRSKEGKPKTSQFERQSSIYGEES